LDVTPPAQQRWLALPVGYEKSQALAEYWNTMAAESAVRQTHERFLSSAKCSPSKTREDHTMAKPAHRAGETVTTPVSTEHITQSILVFRSQKVLLDAELAALYGVSTARLNQQVRRNQERFPEDFMFQLTAAEYAALMLQNATSKPGRGGRRKLPLAFTEHGGFGEVYRYKFSTAEIKTPLQDAVTEAGWTWRGVLLARAYK